MTGSGDTVTKTENSVEAPTLEQEIASRTVRLPGGWRLQRQWQDALLRRMLALADASAVVLVCVLLATVLEHDVRLALWMAVFLPLWIVLAKLHGLYDRDQRSLRHLTVDEIPSIFMWALTGTGMTALVLLALPGQSIQVGTALRMWAIAGTAAFVFRGVMRQIWRRVVPPEATLIVGTGPIAEATRRKLELFPDIHVVVAGAREELPVAELRAHPGWARETDRIILASQALDEALIAELVKFCKERQIKLSVVPPARGVFGTAVQLDHIADLPIVEYNTWPVGRSTLALKRLLDVVVSVSALILLLPLFALVALAIVIDSRGSILFAQLRAGLNGRPFRLYKFRTMVSNAEELLPQLMSIDDLDKPTFKLSNDPRVTRVGRVLRRTSIDELPQLFNVLKGEMSLVGPRPEWLGLVERYEPEHRFRLKLKPGITGPMQVYGRGQLTFDEWLSVEREYIENLSLTRDLRILAMTLAAVVSGRGAY